jgi:HAD superfamily hydrolase (TIGR01509 family)
MTWQAVFWDLDGTLVKTEPLWEIAHAGVAAELGGSLSAATLAGLAGVDLATSVDTVCAVAQRPVRRNDVTRRLLAAVADLYRRGVLILPGALDALLTLYNRGVPMALVTNTSRELVDIVLETLGSGWFTAEVCGDEVLNGKPSPEPYLRAAALLGVDPWQCLAVEDSDHGVQSAQAAGCTVQRVRGRVPLLEPAA